MRRGFFSLNGRGAKSRTIKKNEEAGIGARAIKFLDDYRSLTPVTLILDKQVTASKNKRFRANMIVQTVRLQGLQ